MVSARSFGLFVKFAVLFLIVCLLVLFTAAAYMNRISKVDDDDAQYHVLDHQTMFS